MPSGFQQDSNQLSPSFYRVVLTLGDNWESGGAIYATDDGPNNGAVNPYNWDAFEYLPSSDIAGYQLARGNMRWQAIIEEVSTHADCQVIDVEVSASESLDSADTQPTSIAFSIRYDRDAFLLDAYKAVMIYEDPSNTNYHGFGDTVVNSTEAAIREMVTRGIIRGGSTGYTKSYRVYLFEKSEGFQTNVTITRPDSSDKVWYDVAVNLIDGTELNTIVP